MDGRRAPPRRPASAIQTGPRSCVPRWPTGWCRLLRRRSRRIRTPPFPKRSARTSGRRRTLRLDAASSLPERLVGILDQLEAVGISAMPIKGPVLALRAYGSVVRRWFFDLDILVHRVDLSRARICWWAWASTPRSR